MEAFVPRSSARLTKERLHMHSTLDRQLCTIITQSEATIALKRQQAYQHVPLEDIDTHGRLKGVLLCGVLGHAAHLVQVIPCWLLMEHRNATCTHSHIVVGLDKSMPMLCMNYMLSQASGPCQHVANAHDRLLKC